jgi:predicted pyridoxine 5'-phosphate oxidase superfamily flavin-nucleotide-binding protein
MSDLRSTDQRKVDALAALSKNGDAWLATAGRSGRPHLIAASAWWDGERIVIATTGASRTARNLEETRVARIAIGSPDDAIMIDVELLDSRPVGDSPDEVGRGFAAAVGWDPAEEDGDWKLFRLRPVRIQAYRGYGELQNRDVMRDARWVD